MNQGILETIEYYPCGSIRKITKRKFNSNNIYEEMNKSDARFIGKLLRYITLRPILEKFISQGKQEDKSKIFPSNQELCECGHIALTHKILGDGSCMNRFCPCKLFVAQEDCEQEKKNG